MKVANETSYSFDKNQTATHLPHQQYCRRYFLSLIKKGFISRESTGIEIGPGTGDFAKFLISKGFSIEFVEPSKDAINILKDRYPDVKLHEQCCYSNIKRSEDIHFFFALEVIEHLFDPEAFLMNIFTSMKDGEIFVLSTPYHGYLKNLLICLFGKYDQHHDVSWKVGHIKFFSVNSLHKMANKVGFKCIELRRYGRIPLLSRGMFFLLQK